MFSKALFKQSCKANGMMWGIITAAVCFMLACVMLISGNGNIGAVRNSIQDTIIVKEVDAQLEKRALSYYSSATEGLESFDTLFAANAADTVGYLTWLSAMPTQSNFDSADTYAAAVAAWQASAPEQKTETGVSFAEAVNAWLAKQPLADGYESEEAYLAALAAWQESSPATQESAIAAAYSAACEDLQSVIEEKAKTLGYAANSNEAKEMLGIVMYTLNPNGNFNSFYTDNGEAIPTEYDIVALLAHISDGDVSSFLTSSEREQYRADRAENGAAVFLAGNMTNSESTAALIDALSSYGVTREKYDSFGYTYASVKHMAKTATVTYRGRAEYELSELARDYAAGQFADEAEYKNAISAKNQEIANDISSSFLSTLPSSVSEALEEIGSADLYTLIVGSVFYKLAGLLLPIIYVIMAANNLIAGQVDSGSMAYVLSTSTKRITVVFTQSVYLVGSLLAMFSLTTATSCVCLHFVTEEVELTYGKLALLNLGAFLVLLALSGLCFFTSCIFDRSKHSMAIGGGLSIFALVAAMLGLFGSPVLPSVIRLESLNNFNYATVISLFDVVSIIDGTNAFVWKFAILGVAGIIGYIAGAFRFIKKDLPL